MSMFQKAQKQQLKARVAFVGPTGSGKTWTALEWATKLAGPDGKIAVIDTENNSAAYYSDRYDFDTCPIEEPYEPHRLTEIIRGAVKEGYDAIVVDSLSHFWEGEGGVLDIADAAGKRDGGGNSFAGWRTATPQLRNLIDVLRSSPAHVIVTMRSKMEWVMEENERGKKVPRKLGMAPVMRQGIEYEFTAVIDMNYEHQGMVTKSRCSEIADRLIQPHRSGETAEDFARWLNSGIKLADQDDVHKLIAVLNGITADVARKAAKDELVTRFGPPDRLTAERYPEALAWAESVAAEKVVADSFKAPNGDQPKLVESPRDLGVTPITAKDDRPAGAKQQGQYFALLKEVHPDWTEDERHDHIEKATGGRTRSWTEVTSIEADHLIGDLKALRSGAA